MCCWCSPAPRWQQSCPCSPHSCLPFCFRSLSCVPSCPSCGVQSVPCTPAAGDGQTRHSLICHVGLVHQSRCVCCSEALTSQASRKPCSSPVISVERCWELLGSCPAALQGFFVFHALLSVSIHLLSLCWSRQEVH